MASIFRTFLLVMCGVGLAMAENPIARNPDTGIVEYDWSSDRAMWSEPPDVNGLLGSSEILIEFGIETELANDFVPTEPVITHVTWWGGYYENEIPCEPGIPNPGFNLGFWEEDNCKPGALITELSVTDYTEESIGCQAGWPLYKYEADVTINVVPGNRYWFCAQMKGHDFPPQWGRLQSHLIVGCGSQWRSEYFGEPDWIGACSIIFEECDFSQEFEGDHPEACCFPNGDCEFILTTACEHEGGVPQGAETDCDPNPCEATAIETLRWGAIKLMF
jgi:hypothetical protein